MSLKSALYTGLVSHRRLRPKPYTLRHRLYWLLLDLSELSSLDQNCRLFSHNRTNLISFFERDHGNGSNTPLIEQAGQHLAAAGIETDGVSIQLLCMPRVAGYDFNPLSVYFCTDRNGHLTAIIYEVNNTFGGRHTYVIPTETAPGTSVRQACEKTFYVSPFMDLDLSYKFRATSPTTADSSPVRVAVQALKGENSIINTCLVGHRRPFTDRNIAWLSATHPLLPVKVTGAIYWHALRMWLRGFSINPATPSKTMTLSIVRPEK